MYDVSNNVCLYGIFLFNLHKALVPPISPTILQCSIPLVISVRRGARFGRVKSWVCTCVFLVHASLCWLDCTSILKRGYDMK